MPSGECLDSQAVKNLKTGRSSFYGSLLFFTSNKKVPKNDELPFDGSGKPDLFAWLFEPVLLVFFLCVLIAAFVAFYVFELY